MEMNGIQQRNKKKTKTTKVNSLPTKKARIQNWKKTLSSVSGAGKTGELGVNQGKHNTPLHCAQK